MMSVPLPTICHGCKQEFPSKNAVFKHLQQTEGACLSNQEYDDFCKYVLDRNREKVIILYGYWIEPRLGINNGQHVAQILLQVMENLIYENGDDENDTEHCGNGIPSTHSMDKIPNRSYGYHARSTEIVKQDDGMSAITEVLTTKLPQLPGGGDDAFEQWIQTVNRALCKTCQGVDCIRVLGRQSMPIRRFNAEMDVTHRRIEYLLPADFLFPSSHPAKTLPEFFAALPSFMDGVQSHNFTTQDFERPWDESSSFDPSEARPPNPVTLRYLTMLKKKMQRLTTHIVELNVQDQSAVFEKRLHEQKRQRNKDYQNNKNIPKKEGSQDQLDSRNSTEITKLEPGAEKVLGERGTKQNNKEKKRSRKKQTEDAVKKQNVLRRKRYHNFTPTVMAHEFLSYRRLDRFYHRGTFRFETTKVNSLEHPVRPFLALSLSGDLFLNGQASRLVGLLIALARGVVDEDFVECVFDEKYPHLVPTPPAPVTGLYAADVHYVNAEGKAKAILTPRKCHNFPKGWNDENTLKRVRDWQNIIRERSYHAWLSCGVDADGRLVAEKEWVDNVLLPWAEQAQKQVEEYRLWKASMCANQSMSNPDEEQIAECTVSGESMSLSLVPLLDSVDPTVPPIYEKVLYYLRKADESGLWPSTTLKRQLVMVAKVSEQEKDTKSSLQQVQPINADSLAVSQVQIKGRKVSRTSAYAFVEGEGGASGSFSVGAMPGDLGSKQPKNNALFPELMKAAFQLEMALRPDREPSSTIAINRNALFRPHTDSGAGAGQGTSLIVGLGTYSGGELMVEGKQYDIRYKPVEFNGWKQRHWTMPFRGERFSLVWFTPKGCEGIHGIELCA